jgi:hypothetical protein
VAEQSSLAEPYESAREQCRARFAADQQVVLRGFLAGETLDRVSRGVAVAEFERLIHPGDLKREDVMAPNATGALLMFLLTDPRLFELIRAITGCPPIGSFFGRLYRMQPSSDHRDGWHDDLTQERLVAVSINLSPELYEGGLLELRDHATEAMLARVHNTGIGDALLFPIRQGLVHRVTEVGGRAAKTAYAGWFRGGERSLLAAAPSRARRLATHGATT